MRVSVPKRLALSVILLFAASGVALAVPLSTGPSESAADANGYRRDMHFASAAKGALVPFIDTSDEIDALVVSTPRSLHMAIAPVAATPVHMTLSGFVPGTTSYLYLDDFLNLTVVLADDNGQVAFDLDLPAPRLLIVQQNPSTIHLKADGTGCGITVGTFDAATKTCTLKRDVFQTIQIDDDGVTLDGAGHLIDSSGILSGTVGVMVSERSGVVVKNLSIDAAATGVSISKTSDSRFEHLTITNANVGFLELFESPTADTGRNVFAHNDVSVVCDPADAPCGAGFSSVSQNAADLSDNHVSGAKFGVSAVLAYTPTIADNTFEACATGVSVLGSLTAASVTGNHVAGADTGIVLNTLLDCEVSGNVVDGATIEALRLGSGRCTLSDNTLSNSALGLNLNGSENSIFHNRFLGNTVQASLGQAVHDNLLSQAPRVGGNHWSDFDETAEGCVDGNADGYCDDPYVLDPLTADQEPWAADSAWLDTTPPTTLVSFSGTPGNAGWYISQVGVTLTAQDDPGGTGVLRSECGPDLGALSDAGPGFTLASEGPGNLFCRSIDRAGNAETPQSFDIRIDTAPPTIEANLQPPANANGWNNSAVSVSFTCSDTPSGIALCPDPVQESAEGQDQQVTGTAFDVAGNQASTTAHVSIDETAPKVTLTGGCGGTVVLNGTLVTDVSVTDDLSGIGTQSSPNGSNNLPTSGIGDKSFQVQALDLAGNGANATCKYSIIYDFLGAGGFRQPIDAAPTVNVGKAGSTIPVKFQIPNGLGGFLSSLSIVTGIQAQQVSCSAFDSALDDPIETTTAGSSGLHFDPTAMQYIYNWKTSPLFAGRCYMLLLKLDDGKAYSADFRFTR
jgi:parallel beta-helix repeat protein